MRGKSEAYQHSRRLSYELDWRLGEIKTRINRSRLRPFCGGCAPGQVLVAATT